MAKDEKAYAKRIAAQNNVATGVLTLIVGFICVLLAAIIAYILINGFGKLVDINFLTGDPEQFKAGGGKVEGKTRARLLELDAGEK